METNNDKENISLSVRYEWCIIYPERKHVFGLYVPLCVTLTPYLPHQTLVTHQAGWLTFKMGLVQCSTVTFDSLSALMSTVSCNCLVNHGRVCIHCEDLQLCDDLQFCDDLQL